LLALAAPSLVEHPLIADRRTRDARRLNPTGPT
jgi:hypothetical protein